MPVSPEWGWGRTAASITAGGFVLTWMTSSFLKLAPLQAWINHSLQFDYLKGFLISLQVISTLFWTKCSVVPVLKLGWSLQLSEVPEGQEYSSVTMYGTAIADTEENSNRSPLLAFPHSVLGGDLLAGEMTARLDKAHRTLSVHPLSSSTEVVLWLQI